MSSMRVSAISSQRSIDPISPSTCCRNSSPSTTLNGGVATAQALPKFLALRHLVFVQRPGREPCRALRNDLAGFGQTPPPFPMRELANVSSIQIPQLADRVVNDLKLVFSEP